VAAVPAVIDESPVAVGFFVWYASIIAYLFLNVKHFISEF
jgi:hypothetical protein